MISKEFTVETSDFSTNKVYVKTFTSMGEAVRYVKARPRVDNGNKDCQYFQRGYTDESPSWCGFRNIEDLEDICLNGLHDTGNVTEVIKFAGKAIVQEKDKLVKKHMDVAGGAVDVPLFLSGSPECMMGLKRKKVKTKIIKTAVNCEVLCDISSSEYIEAGKTISRTIVSLEKAGYRVRLAANCGIKSNANTDLAQMSVIIKRENEPCNWRRMLMPLMSPAFFRGIGFNFLSTMDEFNAGFGLGQRMDMAFDKDHREAGLDYIIKQALGDGFSRFSINEVIRMNHKNSPEVTEAFLKAKMLDLCA